LHACLSTVTFYGILWKFLRRQTSTSRFGAGSRSRPGAFDANVVDGAGAVAAGDVPAASEGGNPLNIVSTRARAIDDPLAAIVALPEVATFGNLKALLSGAAPCSAIVVGAEARVVANGTLAAVARGDAHT